VPYASGDALLSLLHPAWQVLLAVCLLVVTILGLRRLIERGPTRMTNALLLTGFLIVAITVIGTLAVACSGPGVGEDPNSQVRAPAR
jgi:heme A synthase